MKKYAFLAAAVFAAFPAQAAQVFPGNGIGGPGATIDLFDATTRGTLLAYSETSGSALTFATKFRSAVYRNTDGRLDFYYQVERTGAGSAGDNAIQSFTAANFGSFDVFAFRDGSDFDGAGGFLPAGNPGTFTSSANRSFDGNVMGVNFGPNNLVGTENSTTYIFRTNAFAFTAGTFGVIDGSTIQGPTFAPRVPEPATWAMMLAGFGAMGIAMRRSGKVKAVLA
ncbi:PEPxxWA-CTERM sorting domain-containing protein [Sphingomonas tabacisoli]|uniref:PEPxxWA-CTERM sorting domain-containing protein n=1 Tax=Sphingomonas tabacisoli TaxID=2249466 RepID=A0ABW4I1G9_9SPHN